MVVSNIICKGHTLVLYFKSLLSLEMMQQQKKLITFPECGVIWLHHSFIKEEISLTTLDFTFAHRLNACVADVEPRPSRWLCNWRQMVWGKKSLYKLGQYLFFFYWLNWLTSFCKSVGCKFWTLWSNFDICCVMSWPHGSTVLYDTIQTVQNLRFSIRHILCQNSIFFKALRQTKLSKSKIEQLI